MCFENLKPLKVTSLAWYDLSYNLPTPELPSPVLLLLAALKLLLICELLLLPRIGLLLCRCNCLECSRSLCPRSIELPSVLSPVLLLPSELPLVLSPVLLLVTCELLLLHRITLLTCCCGCLECRRCCCPSVELPPLPLKLLPVLMLCWPGAAASLAAAALSVAASTPFAAAAALNAALNADVVAAARKLRCHCCFEFSCCCYAAVLLWPP